MILEMALISFDYNVISPVVANWLP